MKKIYGAEKALFVILQDIFGIKMILEDIYGRYY